MYYADRKNGDFFARQSVKKLVAENPPGRKRDARNHPHFTLDARRDSGYMLPFDATSSKISLSGDIRYETHLPAQQMPPQENPRFPGALPHQKRSQGARTSPRQRA
jgi:hypothetical protein